MSVAVALAMLEPGAVGDAQANLRRLLRVDDPAAFHSSMNALTRRAAVILGRRVESACFSYRRAGRAHLGRVYQAFLTAASSFCCRAWIHGAYALVVISADEPDPGKRRRLRWILYPSALLLLAGVAVSAFYGLRHL